MKTGKKNEDNYLKELRNLAQLSFKKNYPPDKLIDSTLSFSELIEELKTHQIELDLQNDELKRANNILSETQEQLKESIEEYSSLYEYAPIGYVTLDANRNILRVNQKLTHLLQTVKNNVINQKIDKFIHPADRDAHYLFFRKFLNEGLESQFHCKMHIKGQKVIWVHLTYNLDSKPGEKKIIKCAVVDITKLRNRETELMESEANLKKAQEIAKIGSWTFDSVTQMPNWSDQMFEIFALPPENGAPSYERHKTLIHPDDWERFDSAVHNAITMGIGYDLELKIMKGSGGFGFINSRCDVETSTDGTVRLNGICQDITDRKLLEMYAKKNEDYLNSFFTAAPVGLGIVIDRVIQFVNKRFCEMIGYTENELINKSAKILYPSLEEFERVGKLKYDEIGKLGIGSIETKFKTKSGEILDILMSSTPIDKGDFSKGITFSALDITSSKEAERALSESEKRFQLLMESFEDPITAYDKDANIQLINLAGANNFNLPEEQIVGRPLKEFLPEFHDETLRRIKQSLKQKKNLYFEDKIELKSGTHWFWSIFQPQFLSEGKQLFLVISYDITEQKLAELEKEEKQRQLSTLFGNLPGMAFRCLNDKNWTMKIVSEGSFSLAGYKPSELIDNAVITYADLIIPEDRKRVHREVSDAIKVDRHYEIEYRLRTRKGNLKYVWEKGIGIKNSKRNREFIEGFIMDITSLKEAEFQTQKSEEQYRQLFNSTNDILLVYNISEDFIPGSFEEVNDVTCRKMGYSKSKMHNLNIIDIISADSQKLYWDSLDIISKEASCLCELELVDKKGKTIPVELSSRYFEFDEEKKIIAIGRDITQRKMIERQLQDSYDSLQMLNDNLQKIREEERTNMAREIHDGIGQSLTGIKMDISWLRRSLVDGNTEENLSKCDEMVRLVDDSLDITRNLSSRLRPVILDDFGLVPAMEWYLEVFEKQSGIKCTAEMHSGEIQFSDKLNTAIFRIFQEALTNVIRHANATKVKISLIFSDNILEMKVVDNGIGISPDKVGSRHSLGFIGIKERLRPFGGNLFIEGEKGRGTNFRITIPNLNLITEGELS